MDRELEPADFFVLRTPLLPFDEFLRWGDDADRALLRERLLEAVRRPELREAVYLSSPAVVALLDGDDGDVLRVERALVRYFSRATGRATPHGLLAGVSWGRVGDRTELVLAGRETYSRRARLSLEFLLELVELLGAEPNAQEEDRYRANGTIYWAAGRVRYIGGGSRRRHSHLELRSVSAHPSVEAVVAKAQQPATRDELATAASVDRRLVGRMIEAGLLVPDRRVPLTGDLHDAGLWPARGTRGGPENTVAECESLLASLSGDPPGVATRSYDEIARRLGGLGVSESTARFRVDLEKPAHTATLGRDVAREIARGVTLLHRITRHAPPDPELAHFVERFRERFADREVPLLEALDSEVGAGFGPGPELDETLLTGIRESRSGDAGWGPRERLLARRLPAALQAGGAELVLSARDVEELAAAAGPHLPLPDELAAIAVVAAESAQALALGSFQVLVKGYGGPGGVGAAARFCRTPEQAELVREHLRREESLDEDALFAEIVHLPSEPHADLVARPLLRDYEIVCAGASGAPAERQIDLSDLQLALDPSGALVLRSRRLARRIIPRLTNPHNFMLFGAKPYRFLCKLQFQRTSGRVDFWGPLAELPRLPRVRSGRIVLQRASWRITSRDLAGDPLTALGRWRHENDVPRLVALVELDRELPVDLDNPFSAGALADRLLALGEVLLVEWFPDPDRLCVRGPEGRFVHELLVPFVLTAPSVAPPRA
ncbi:MAG: lantibiotic dehydratase family protein, partial [Gaiellaceae bacterium]